MTVLAVDTSHGIGAVTLARDGEVLGTEYFGAEGSHLAELTGCADRLLRDQGFSIDGMDRVALVSGPGSFTGLRIGCAFAKGLYAAADLDIVVMDTLSLLIAPHFADNTVCAMIDARRREVYAAARAPGGEMLAPRVAPVAAVLDALAETVDVFVGTGAILYGDDIRARFPAAVLLGEHDALPSTAYLALAAESMTPLTPDGVAAFEPMYIRPSDAQLKRLQSIGNDARRKPKS